jgi:hypothetical protein
MSIETPPSTCRLVRAGQDSADKQGLTYTPAISAAQPSYATRNHPAGQQGQAPQKRGARDGNLRS